VYTAVVATCSTEVHEPLLSTVLMGNSKAIFIKINYFLYLNVITRQLKKKTFTKLDVKKVPYNIRRSELFD
jgi:hypothetical protein